MPSREAIDICGIGCGPSNLSLAALLHPMQRIRKCFLDRSRSDHWHAINIPDNTTLQTHFLKDLVTPVDPTSPFSFLNYIRSKKRFYSFINTDRTRVPRSEFADYLEWVENRIDYIHHNIEVADIEFDGNVFVVHTTADEIHSTHISIGVGVEPSIPEFCASFLGTNCFHSSNFCTKFVADKTDQCTLVVGGGQSGAEIVLDLISRTRPPRSIVWVLKSNRLFPLDECACTNELFTPSYSDYFFAQDRDFQNTLLKDHKHASDGISTDTLITIYRRLYDAKLAGRHDFELRFIFNSELTSVSREESGRLTVVLKEAHTRKLSSIQIDLLILATGYKRCVNEVLSSIRERLNGENPLHELNRDYSLNWNGPLTNKIFVQNACREQRGVADPNLSLLAWRSATIANSIAGMPFYDLDNNSVINWVTVPEDPNDHSFGESDFGGQYARLSRTFNSTFADVAGE